MRPDCPECGEPMGKPFTSCKCGWRERPVKRGENDKQCVWNDHGFRCQNYGPLSDTLHGAGPWYCREHFAKLKGWPAYQAAAVDEPMSEVDKRVNKLVPRREGESEHDWSMRCKAWVLARLKRGVLRQPIREPGEDEQEAA